MSKTKGEPVKPPTLCFSCGNACVRGCSWADNATPVGGWTAEENRLGWRVIACPEFIPDTERKLNNPDKDGCLELLKAVLERAREDYITGSGENKSKGLTLKEENRQDVERFIRSKYAARLFHIVNPEKIMLHLKRLAWEYENPPEPEEKEGEEDGVQSVPCEADRIEEVRESSVEPDGSGDRDAECSAGSDPGVSDHPAESS